MHFIKWGVFRPLAVTAIFLFFIFCKIATAESERGDYVTQRQDAVKEYLQGHFGEAETLFQKAFHEAETNQDEYATALNLSGLGDVYQTEGRFDEAETAYKRSLSIFRRTPDSNLAVAIELHHLGALYTGEQEYANALAVLNEAFKLTEEVQIPHEKFTGQILNSLGVVYFYQERTRKAESLFQAAIQSYSVGGTAWNVDLAQSINNLAEVFKRKHQFQKAEDAYKRSIALTEAQLGPTYPDLAVILDNLGDVYRNSKRYTEAETQYRRSLNILERVEPVLTVPMIHTLYELSKVYLEAGDKTRAEEVLARATAFVGPRPTLNPEIPDVLESYSRLLQSAGKSRQAEDLHWRAARAVASMTLTVRAQDLK